MDCFIEYQTECLKVVTIGYLKTFIGNNIQDSNGNIVIIQNTDDTYCPTYEELTNGSIIQSHVQGVTPNSDIDGILVSTAITQYRNDQVVDQLDLSLIWTRHNSLNINASSTEIGACGGTSQLSFTNTYNRYKKYMNDSCEIPEVPSSTTVSDTSTSEITWHKELADASINTSTLVYSLPKNEDESAAVRYDHISASTSFRGAEKNSNVILMTQSENGGDYTVHDSYYYVTTAATAEATTDTTFVSCGSVTYGAKFTLNQDRWETRHWKDSCGAEDPTKTKDFNVGPTASTVYSSVTRSWGAVECPTSSSANSDTIAFTYTDPKTSQVFNGSVSFSRTCEQSCCSSYEYRITSPIPSDISGIDNCGLNGSFTISMEYKCADGGTPTTWEPYTDFVTTVSFVQGDNFVSFTNLEYEVSKNCTTESKSGVYSIRVKSSDSVFDETYNVTFSQTAGRCPDCGCDCESLIFDEPILEPNN